MKDKIDNAATGNKYLSCIPVEKVKTPEIWISAQKKANTLFLLLIYTYQERAVIIIIAIIPQTL